MLENFQSRYSAFSDGQLVARGSYTDLARALADHLAAQGLQPPNVRLLVFDDATGAPVDTPPTPEQADRLAARGLLVPGARRPEAPVKQNEETAPRPTPGRPRLGVVAREVTLLPRHWDWLAVQPGGASAALRRLVDRARSQAESADKRRAAGERSYKFMSAIAGDRPEFEEAARALFAGDAVRFAGLIATWPPDVRTYLMELSDGAFSAPNAEGEKA